VKLNKFTKTAIAFTVGASVFVTTAFADMLLGSGYDKLKQAIKATAKYADETFESYTLQSNMELKIDDELVQHHSSTTKIDYINKQKHNQDVTTNFLRSDLSSKSEQYIDADYVLYSYNDEPFTGYHNMYTKDEFDPGDDFSEAFTGEYSDEIERIIDAAVGNLKNLVQYNATADGAYQFSGELTATQVPALYNAVLSLLLKESMTYELDGKYLNKDTKDIYVSNVSGYAKQHPDGYLTELEAELELTFKNENNVEHKLLVSGQFQIIDINQTKIDRPQFDESLITENYDYVEQGLHEKYEGVYKSNLVVDTGNQVIKIGERILTIENIEAGKIHGTYEEVITNTEYSSEYSPLKLEFIDTTHEHYTNQIEYKDLATGEAGIAIIYENMSDSLYFEYGLVKDSNNNLNYDKVISGQFTKVFE